MPAAGAAPIALAGAPPSTPDGAPPLALGAEPSTVWGGTPLSAYGGGEGGGDASTAAVHPSLAADRLKTSGRPAKALAPVPAVMTIAHSAPTTRVVTLEAPALSSGASKTTWRAALSPAAE